MYSVMWIVRTAAYAAANTSGPFQPPSRSSYASGIVKAATNTAIIASVNTVRRNGWSADAWFEIQLKPAQVHHMSDRMISAWKMPTALWVSAISRDTWVKANT